MKNFLPLFVLIVLFLNHAVVYSQSQSEDRSNIVELMKRKEVKGIYLFNSNVEIDTFFRNCKKIGVNCISTNDFFYKNKQFVEKAKQNGINVILNFPVYFDQEYLEKNPEYYCIDSEGKKAMRGWLHFACPSQSDFFEYQKNKLKDWLEFVNPQMVSFDFLRFFVFWEKVYPHAKHKDIVDGCYCDKCISDFQKYTNLNVEIKSAEWIKDNFLQEWADWKCNVIEQRLSELVTIVKQHDENILIGLKILPWSENDFNGAIRSIAGQDAEMLSKYVDVFIPMTYSHMLKRKPSWINDITSEIHDRTGKQVIASIQIKKTYLEEKISDTEFIDMIKFGKMPPVSGTILFHYDYILNVDKKNLGL
jgi:hypothetical protein